MGTNGLEDMRRMSQDAAYQSEVIRAIGGKQADQVRQSVNNAVLDLRASVADVFAATKATGSPLGLVDAWTRYMRDAAQRAALTLDVMRQSSDAHAAHADAGSPPVLIYDYELIVDGADLRRPCNYVLLRILPPEGMSVDDTKRPYIIIDPRAGHGAGIGGFKPDSQIGVALAKSHPVYFVSFRIEPVAGQTLADVCDAEAVFVSEVSRRHPDSKKPVVVGNCQAGWASAVMAATHPEVTGPIILNGAPMSYWAGNVGRYPMRYSAGVFGGLPLTLMSSDLGAGIFDGSSLVLNFEQLNPSRNWFTKYYDLFRDVDKAGVDKRFIDFERWWGAYYMMTDEEIRWIVEQLFVGNYLGRNQAQLDPGVPIDLKKIRGPVICFASEGDNITPPAQALNWILDTYTDEHEVIASRQRIFYMVHDQVGHLGIFVSSSIAKKEHKGMASLLETIENVPPGLYEICIDDESRDADNMNNDEFVVRVAQRTFADLAAVTGDRRDEASFAGVARASEAGAEAYETFLRPWVKASVSPELAKMTRQANPMRVKKTAFASNTPMGMMAKTLAHYAGSRRDPVDDSNPFIQAERFWADYITRSMDIARDVKEAATELAFFSLWSTPWALAYGAPKAGTRYHEARGPVEHQPEVLDALARLGEGGLAAGIARLAIAYADEKSSVELGQVQRIATAVKTMTPFKDLSEGEKFDILDRQRIIVRFTPDHGLDSLPLLIKNQADRKQAEDVLRFIFQPDDDDVPLALKQAWESMVAHLGIPPKKEKGAAGRPEVVSA
ncbi:MAG: DUF3141 domain-containing protein [Pseudomonadota bacterium]